MTAPDKPKPGRGGPRPGFGGAQPGAGRPLAADAPTVGVTLRVTPAQRDKLRALGGAAWLRQQIDAA